MYKSIFLVLLLVLSGCGGGAVDNDYISGNWQLRCMGIGVADEPIRKTMSIVLSFSDDNNLTMQLESFSDADCLVPVEKVDPIVGTYRLGKPIVTMSGVSAVELDMTYPDEGPSFDIVSVKDDVMMLGGGASEQDERPQKLDSKATFERIHL